MPGNVGDARKALQQISGKYPRHVSLGEDTIEFRLMSEDNVDAMLKFARTIPPDGLVYLVANCTEEPVVRSWVENIKAGRALAVLAVKENTILCEGTLLHNATSWTRHLGEIRIQISPASHRHGLARMLADKIDRIARQLELQLLTARMTLDQAAAQLMFG